MKTLSPLQWHNLGKSFTLFFVLLTLGWSVVSFLTLGDIYVSWLLLSANLFFSSVLAWIYYRHRYHTRFSYNEAGFEMVRGRLKTCATWSQFGSVSLVHLGGGHFAVRLYKGEAGTGDSVEIPASDLDLDPPQFRFEVMTLIKPEEVTA